MWQLGITGFSPIRSLPPWYEARKKVQQVTEERAGHEILTENVLELTARA